MSSSGGPAIAAIAFAGDPFMMNAMPGPEPSATSIPSPAVACCSLASPAKAINSISRPYFWKMPLRIPTSSGTNEKASGTALPTRNLSAAKDDVAKVASAAGHHQRRGGQAASGCDSRSC